MRKAHLWGFPEILSHLEKDMDYQSGQAEISIFIFWKKNPKMKSQILIWSSETYHNRFQIISKSNDSDSADFLTLKMLFWLIWFENSLQILDFAFFAV